MPIVYDAAGGYADIHINVPGAAHRMRLHLWPFNSTTGVWSSPPSGTAESGAPVQVQDSLALLIAALRPFYFGDVQLSVAQIVANNLSTHVETVTNIAVAAPVNGSAAGNSPAENIPRQATYNAHDTSRNRAKLVLLTYPWVNTTPIVYAGTESNRDGVLVGVWTHPANGFTSRHGLNLTAPVRATFTLNKRLRRKSGQA